jgi:AbrB family looped-hinge helix DNA binding protein
MTPNATGARVGRSGSPRVSPARRALVGEENPHARGRANDDCPIPWRLEFADRFDRSAAERRTAVRNRGAVFAQGKEVILVSMTYRVGPKGQVVIPKAMRDWLGIVPGDEVDFELDNDAVRVAAVREVTNLRGSLAGRGLTAALEADRRAERDR